MQHVRHQHDTASHTNATRHNNDSNVTRYLHDPPHHTNSTRHQRDPSCHTNITCHQHDPSCPTKTARHQHPCCQLHNTSPALMPITQHVTSTHANYTTRRQHSCIRHLHKRLRDTGILWQATVRATALQLHLHAGNSPATALQLHLLMKIMLQRPLCMSTTQFCCTT